MGKGYGHEAMGYGKDYLTYSLSPIASRLPYSLLPIAYCL